MDADQASLTLVLALQARWKARLIETHISWVLLDGVHAWKIKKPVHLGFLDFRELRTRRQLCEVELTLNRRLAPSLYLAVHDITGTPSAPQIGGAGEPIEAVLQMRQFAPGALLSEQLSAGTLQVAQLTPLAERLARFHAAAAVAASDAPWGTPQAIQGAVQPVLDGLAAHTDAACLARLQRWCDAQAALLAPVWRQRRQDGRVIEGHGDLHLANTVLLDDGVTAFDAIEFDPALRWIDGLCDVAFLAMDLMARDRSDLAWAFLNAYLDARGDHDGLPVLRYYLVYRALVRAFVACLRRDQRGQGEGEAQPDYLGLAGRLCEPGTPRLLLTHGLSGSGKSVVSAALMAEAGAVRLRSDVVRKRLHGLDPLARSARDIPAGIYGAGSTEATYARLHELARQTLQCGYPVIVDATFLDAAERARFLALAGELSVPVRILHCHAPDEVLRQRVAARQAAGQDPSEADLAVLAAQMSHCDPLSPEERAITLDVDTSAPVDVKALARDWRAAPGPLAAGGAHATL